MNYSCKNQDLEVDGGIIFEKEIFKEELVVVLEFYWEVWGVFLDVIWLLEIFFQMERYQ